ncbi:SpoIIE family protein phosphatase [Sphingomonas sp. HDW15A]|uniref:PP2C family protein-serine/threonine phosphatase n=1 Tax=Sphingomonas sp. HDW15A TaxID=2714942 RepID=UPI00140DD47E|nr:SpoIIE family protein phosphatase [Sphingomonas sp. HDW15A]QIK95750.1 SpoIIE family protein phosphatase [Sphingomonas sp. HDW15A]
MLTSIPELDDVAFGHAMLNGAPDSDGIVRSVPLTVIAGNRAFPGFAAELARLSAGAPAMRWDGVRLKIGPHAIPAEKDGRIRLRFGEIPRQAVYSADRVMAMIPQEEGTQSAVPANAFTGKAVLIGLAAEGSADLVATPLQTEGYGVYVQAQAVDAILTGGWLQRPPWVVAAEWLAGAMLALLVVLAALTRRWWLLGAAVLAAALPIASWTAFDRENLLFDPARPLTIFAGAALALLALLFIRAKAERERLAAALIEQRISSARQEGELQAARSIQLGMVPGPERLSKLDERVEISGQLDPARSVGGDFYDASKFDEDRILLVIGDVTGKGIPAALYMALSKGLARSILSRKQVELGDAVSSLNRELLRDADEAMGVTMLIAILDCATGEVTMVNAGHENPIIRTVNGEIHSVAMTGGPPFCVCDFPYKEEHAQLGPGDSLILITDGVSEAENGNGEFFGVSGAIAAAKDTAGENAENTAKNLAIRVRLFEGETEPSDDLTVLVARLKAAPA